MERMKDCASVSALADELGIHRTVLYHWQRQLKAAAGDSSARGTTSPIRELRQQVRELKRSLADSPSGFSGFHRLVGRGAESPARLRHLHVQRRWCTS